MQIFLKFTVFRYLRIILPNIMKIKILNSDSKLLFFYIAWVQGCIPHLSLD